MKTKTGLLIFLFLLLLAATFGWKKVKADQETKDVLPYEIWSIDGVHVYKQVYQGCELFIARTPAGRGADGVAITTGRGCGK